MLSSLVTPLRISISVGPKISEMSPSSKEKIREDVQEAMAEKEEGNNVKIPVDVW